MKKRLAFVTTIILMIALLATACNNSGKKEQSNEDNKSSGEKTKISIWHNFAGDDLRAKAVRDLIDKYKEEHPDVEVDAQAIPVDGYR